MIRLKPKEKSKGLKRTPLKRKPFKRKLPIKIAFLTKTPPKKRYMKLDELDILFSKFIRMRAVKRTGGCERCLTPHKWQDLQCSHFYGRGDKSTRWDESNGKGTCGGCHFYLDSHPLYHVQWMEQFLGKEQFELLQGRNRQMGKPDKKILTLYYQQEIKKLENSA
jgi:hypothetical protein